MVLHDVRGNDSGLMTTWQAVDIKPNNLQQTVVNEPISFLWHVKEYTFSDSNQLSFLQTPKGFHYKNQDGLHASNSLTMRAAGRLLSLILFSEKI